MNTKPILFSGDMVRALLDGRKTQTRRVMSKSDAAFLDWCSGHPDDTQGNSEDLGMKLEQSGIRVWCSEYPEEGSELLKYRYGQSGDLLWVRETFCPADKLENAESIEWWGCTIDRPYAYAADDLIAAYADEYPPSWKPSIHMPRWASRITLKITDVRVQRLQEITRQEAAAEGVCLDLDKPLPEWCQRNRWPEENFRALWDSINEKRGFGWNRNPWVWALTFEVIRANVDAVIERQAA